jgi:hypothetical protein
VARRWLLTGVVTVALAECVLWYVAASIGWATRDIFVGSGAPQAAARARFALALFAGAGINVVALVSFLVRRRGFGWWLLVAIEIGNLAVSLVEAVVRDAAWWLSAALAALALGLLFGLRRLAEASVPR